MESFVAGVLAVALGIGVAVLAPHAAGHPTVWITIGGQVATIVILIGTATAPAHGHESTAAPGER